MALKALMLGKSIRLKEAELKELREKDADFASREEALTSAIEEAESDADRRAVEEMVSEFDTERRAHEAAVATLESELAELRGQLEEIEKNQEPPAPAQQRGAEHKEERSMPNLMFDVRTIRNLPVNLRAFDQFPFSERQRMVATPQAQEFLAEIRSIISDKRAVTGADLTIPIEFLDIIRENTFRYSKLLARVRVRDGRGTARQTIAGTVPEAVWTECCGALNELEFSFSQVEVDCYKVGGYVPLCNSLLEESDLDLAGEVLEMISQAIGYALDKAILYGRENLKMPTGIVPSLAQTAQPSNWDVNGPAWVDLHETNLITIDANLTGAAFWSALRMAAAKTFTVYNRGETFWAMNSMTYAMLESKAIATTVTGEWVAMIGGRLPIVSGNIDVLEFIPTGDIIGGYGDLYLLRRHSGTTIGADETGYINRVRDITLFFGKSRADGKPIIRGAFVGININGQAVTTEMTFAGDIANTATLNALSVGTETLNPGFDPTVPAYAITAANASDKIEATPTVASAAVSISYNGQNVRNGGTVTWLADGTAHPLTVTVTNGAATVVYTVTVTRVQAIRAGGGNPPVATVDGGAGTPGVTFEPALASLSLGAATLTPKFSADVTNYTASTTNSSNAISAIPSNPSDLIAVTVNGSELMNGASASWNNGANVVTVTVTSPTSGTSTVYTINLTKET